jgi:hypothetical protein
MIIVMVIIVVVLVTAALYTTNGPFLNYYNVDV